MPLLQTPGTKFRVHWEGDHVCSLMFAAWPKTESSSVCFLLHSPLLMLLTHIMRSFIGLYRILALQPPIWENDINLWVTKFVIHCKIQGPQSRTIKATITVVNIVFHHSPFTQDRTEVQKGMFSFDIAFTWFFMSSKAVDTLPISQECMHNIQP